MQIQVKPKKLRIANFQAKGCGKFDTGYDEEQTYSVDRTTTWRVLGLSEEGNIHLFP